MADKAIALLRKALEEFAQNHEGWVDEVVLDDAHDLLDAMEDYGDNFDTTGEDDEEDGADEEETI